MSRFLSLVLRHRPGLIGVELDGAGWVEVDELLLGCQKQGFEIDRSLLAEIVAENDKQRFAFSEDGRRIRASQGHSVAVELDYQALEPPTVLYHGTHRRALPSILREGLRKGQRHAVHLSVELETATRVGSRRGGAVILRVDARGLWQSGQAFYRSANGVWLTEAVPVVFLEVFRE